MRIVSLTTDFGTRDFYVGALKGALLKRNPELKLVDITHGIEPFNIVQGAFILRQSWHEYPEGTIHLLGVNCVYARNFRYIALRHEGHFFLAPDNGILSLVFPNQELENVRIIPHPADQHFPVKTAFADAVDHLAAGKEWDELGLAHIQMVKRINLHPVTDRTRIRGTIIHVDNFDNAVVNITREDFDQIGQGRPFSLYFKRNDPITQLSQNYCDVEAGEPLCLFNNAGLLEVSVNMGRAASLLGLKESEVVELVFEQIKEEA